MTSFANERSEGSEPEKLCAVSAAGCAPSSARSLAMATDLSRSPKTATERENVMRPVSNGSASARYEVTSESETVGSSARTRSANSTSFSTPLIFSTRCGGSSASCGLASLAAAQRSMTSA
eukprot:Amastigsp_a349903_14.p3 type:complete len:121 gc:universal Amastigsp_a349903_14:935-573(-)